MFSRENMKNTKKVGNTGENIAAAFLVSKGYRVLARNYSKKWGELDVVAQRGSVTHFVEVKTISRENKNTVSRESSTPYRPEENMHRKKVERLHRAIQSYIGEYGVTGEWQLDLVAVTIFVKDKEAHCSLIKNVL